ncbi:MAG: hybrid sensor histidine kinase/response regulator [Snowella sp.]|nr:hybrid sensor histidine kinase/response regulator [Snowella sp.]
MTTVLIIEDQADVRENINAILELEGYETLTAEHGLMGVELAKAHRPDLILCDVMMPQLDGYGVLQKLQQNTATASIPFIFLTAKAERASLRSAMELGADDYLTKPFTLDELLNAIAARLAKHSAIEADVAQELHQLRSNITRSLPHELLTPLNGILASADLLISFYDSLEPEEILSSLEDIKLSGHRLHRLIQNFLLFAELELIATTPERAKAWQNRLSQVVNSKPTIQKIAETVAQNFDRCADLSLTLEDAIIGISEVDLIKITEEIIDNAFKFSQKGTPIIVTTTVSGNQFMLSISDRGRGMTPEQIDKIGAYMQFERKLYEQQGSGLGLVIAQRVTELYGGQFKISSILNQQTMVIIQLSLSQSTQM